MIRWPSRDRMKSIHSFAAFGCCARFAMNAIRDTTSV
jgi:hypothetical protein